MFKITAQNRIYDSHRPNGCTVLTIEVEQWPGNEFGLWLPEAVYLDKEGLENPNWCNWKGEIDDIAQKWQHCGDTWIWEKLLNGLAFTSALDVDAEHRCLWYRHSFENRSASEMTGLVAERFHGAGAVGVACRNFKMVFNNNDCIPRCIHSEPLPLGKLPSGQTACQEGVILFSETGHDEMREYFDEITSSRWKDRKCESAG